MLKSRTYTEQVLRWKLIPPWFSLFLSTDRPPGARVRPVVQGRFARPSAQRFSNALIFSLLPGNGRHGCFWGTAGKFRPFGPVFGAEMPGILAPNGPESAIATPCRP